MDTNRREAAVARNMFREQGVVAGCRWWNFQPVVRQNNCVE